MTYSDYWDVKRNGVFLRTSLQGRGKDVPALDLRRVLHCAFAFVLRLALFNILCLGHVVHGVLRVGLLLGVVKHYM